MAACWDHGHRGSYVWRGLVRSARAMTARVRRRGRAGAGVGDRVERRTRAHGEGHDRTGERDLMRGRERLEA